MQPSDALLGFCASIVTELLKYFPALRGNAIVTSIVALVVLTVGVFFTNGGTFSWASFSTALVSAFISYKMIVAPVATAFSLRTQA